MIVFLLYMAPSAYAGLLPRGASSQRADWNAGFSGR